MPGSTVFISYSHKDEAWKDRLLDQLGVLEEEGLLRTWNDRNIGAGDDWFEEIRKAMESARVAVFLVSASSLKSKFIRHKEIPFLLERRVKDGMVFFPVILKSSVWQELPWLARFQVRPLDGRPLAGFQGNRRDEELAKIAKEILKIAREGSQPSAPVERTSIASGTAFPSLHQLPSPPADFTGREEELNALRSTLAQGGAGAIFGLHGMGGIGKTALALELADELTPLYRDAQLYLDLKGVGPQPLTAAQAMSHVIRSFQPEARLPESEAELAGLYRSVLHGKRTLLLMDNAASRGQVEPLLPPKGSLLLVTSRFHFTLPGLVERDLDELPAEDARKLLLKIAPRIEKEADTIACLCGGLPLALRLTGSALAERPDLSPSDYARRREERFGPVQASLRLSYELLNEEQRRYWRLLAVFPSTFEIRAAAAVWELEVDPALDVLGELVRSSLVEWRKKTKRYRLHDLARDFATRRLGEEERVAGQRLHAEYFLALLRTADDLYLQGGETLGQALRLFDDEWSNLQAGFAWASDRSREDETAARICCAYPNAAAYLFELRQHPKERIGWRELSLAVAKKLKDRAAELFHLGSLGNAYVELGEYRWAIKYYEEHLAISRETGNRGAEGQTLGNMGLAYVALGEPHRGIELCEQGLAIACEIGDRRGEGSALGYLGNAYAALGELRRAIELYERRLAIAREIGDRRGEGSALGNLGNAYAALGDPRCAIEYYEQQLTIAHGIGDRRGEGQTLNNLGNAYAALGETRRAIEYYEQRLAIAREIGDRRGEANASWNLGLAIEKEGDLARAADLMQVLVDYEREIGHPDAEEHAADVAALRARIAEQSS
jgi:tetratricopeptide (TPR) repeat protein